MTIMTSNSTKRFYRNMLRSSASAETPSDNPIKARRNHILECASLSILETQARSPWPLARWHLLIVDMGARHSGSPCCVAQAASCRPELALRCCRVGRGGRATLFQSAQRCRQGARGVKIIPSACLTAAVTYPQQFCSARSRS